MSEQVVWVKPLWSVLQYIWKHPDEANAWANRVRTWFTRKDKPGILILGPGGTGKSTLAKMLAGEFDASQEGASVYNESWRVETVRLNDDPKVSLVVPPGQQHRRNATWNDLLNEVSAGKYRGVILLSAYGYHSIGKISYKEISSEASSPTAFIAKYTHDKLTDELSVLRKIAPHVDQNRHPMWLLSMVTKEDLWFPQKSEVKAHYSAGEYGKALKELVAKKDDRTFRHEHVLGSLLISNFETGVGELLQHTAAGYDHAAQSASLRDIVRGIDELMKWELR